MTVTNSEIGAYLDSLTDIGTPASGDELLIYDVSVPATKKVLASALGGGASTGGILAVTNYNPVSDGSYSITGTTLADLDATNAKVTFTAPASGKVLVRVGVLCGSTASGADPSCVFGLRESSTQVGDLVMIMNATAGIAHRDVAFYVTGISAGSHTYKLAGMLASSGGTGTVYFGQTERGGVVIVVEACP